MTLSTIPEAIEEIKAGKFIIVVDDEGRENEGDLVIAAEKVTPDEINFMAKYARGLICVPLTAERIEELRRPLRVQRQLNPPGSTGHRADRAPLGERGRRVGGAADGLRAGRRHRTEHRRDEEDAGADRAKGPADHSAVHSSASGWKAAHANQKDT